MPDAPKTNIDVVNAKALEELADIVRKLKFGHITITVHNSKIMQIDRTEKIRFNDTCYEKGSGI